MQMESLPSRLYYMLLDTVDLRKANWKSKNDAKGPKTISEIREDALAQQAAAEAERARQSQRGPRPPVGRGDARSFSGGGMMPPPDYPRNHVGIDDLKKLARGVRQTGSAAGSSLVPTSMLGSRSNSGRRGGLTALPRGAEDSGASSRTSTPPVKEKESTASANQYRYGSFHKCKRTRRSYSHYSALAGLESGEGADEVASPPSAASSPPVMKSHPAIASVTASEDDSRNPGTTSSS
jgi:translation initiation factor 4G